MLTLVQDLELNYLQLFDALQVTLISEANKNPTTTEIKAYLT